MQNDRHVRLDLLEARLAQAEAVLREVGGERDDARVARAGETFLLERRLDAQRCLVVVLGAHKRVDLLDLGPRQELRELVGAERARRTRQEDDRG